MFTQPIKNLIDRMLTRDDLQLEVEFDDDAGVIFARWLNEDGQERGTSRIEVRQEDDTLVWQHLNFHPDHQKADMVDQCSSRVGQFARMLNLKRVFVPSAMTPYFKSALIDRGWESTGEVDDLIVDVSSEEDSRLEQYWRWRVGKGNEPDWHKKLPPEHRRTKK